MTDYAKRKTGPDGWFDIRSSLCLWLGERLAYMAENFRSHPPYYTADEWKRALNRHATALLDQHRLDTKGDADDASIYKAQLSIEWVAKNLDTMWD